MRLILLTADEDASVTQERALGFTFGFQHDPRGMALIAGGLLGCWPAHRDRRVLRDRLCRGNDELRAGTAILDVAVSEAQVDEQFDGGLAALTARRRPT
ncbi:MAG: hypothetical protein QM750_19815 [Rubrivivax sp.]